MAYSDYGAFVYCNGERRKDKEDAPLCVADKEAFLIHAKEAGQDLGWLSEIYHGVLGDGSVRVACYKYGLPQIYDMGCKDGSKEIDYYDAEKTDSDDFEAFSFEFVASDYKMYKFSFYPGGSYAPYTVEMREQDGTLWTCTYGYGYGAGFEDD